MKSVQYIIVGQGIAGTAVALELLRRNLEFIIFDVIPSNRASLITSGLINPVTGRRFVKSWKWSQLKNQAVDLYSHAEELLQNNYMQLTQLKRVMQNKQQEDRWLERTALPEYSELLSPELLDLETPFTSKEFYGETRGVIHVRMDQLLSDFRDQMIFDDRLVESKVRIDEIDFENRNLRNYSYQHLIDCTGFSNWLNPELLQSHTQFSTGERILIRFIEPVNIELIKFKYFVIPWGENTYWIGSYNTWDTLSNPTDQARTTLKSFVESKLSIPFEILEHHHGTRMSTQDRRPIVGCINRTMELYVLNGLGTKGVSLGPFCANQLVQHIEKSQVLDPEIDVLRFENR